jgi:outer membrane lipoprotein-sorting protein
VVGLRKGDGRLKSIRGVPITELDWGSFYKTFREHAARPDARATLAPRDTSDAPYLVTLTSTEHGTRVKETYRIDPTRWTMLEGEVFENDVRVDHIVFRDVTLDAGTPDKFFRL